MVGWGGKGVGKPKAKVISPLPMVNRRQDCRNHKVIPHVPGEKGDGMDIDERRTEVQLIRLGIDASHGSNCY
jgi:hypothetical protein